MSCTNNLSITSTGAALVSVVPTNVHKELIDRSGVILVAGVPQQVLSSRIGRNYLLVQNNSDTDMWFNFGEPAALSQPSILLPGRGCAFIMEGAVVSTQTVSIICAVANKSYTVKELI